MTGPVTYLATPHPTLPMPCDGVDGFGDVSRVDGQNFDKVRALLATPPARIIRYSATQSPATVYPTPVASGGWVDVPVTTFPTLNVGVPVGCLGLWISFTAQVGANRSSGNYMFFGPRGSGAGLAAAFVPDYTYIGVRNGYLQASRNHLLLPNQLVAGQSVLFTPQVTYSGNTGATYDQCYYTIGVLHVYVLTGK